MNVYPRFFATASGFALYHVSIYVAGFIAAIPIPKAYFDFLGKQHVSLALLIEEAALLALPCFVLSAVWSWSTIRALRQPVRMTVTWCLVGLAMGWLFWQFRSVASYDSLPEPKYSVVTLFLDGLAMSRFMLNGDR